MKQPIAILCVLLAVLLVQGCSVVMAAKQPDKKNLDLLQVGTQRSLLIAEFGSPVHSETRDGVQYDIFNFVQGYGGAAKTGRAVGHAAADVLTLGLWEVVGTPAEGHFDGKEKSYEVAYSEDGTVSNVILLGGE